MLLPPLRGSEHVPPADFLRKSVPGLPPRARAYVAHSPLRGRRQASGREPFMLLDEGGITRRLWRQPHRSCAAPGLGHHLACPAFINPLHSVTTRC